jgi:hypothetical protein
MAVPIVPRILLATYLLAITLAANAQPGSAAGDLTGTRPNAGGEPEEITVGIGVLDIVDIDDRAQVFTADLFVQAEWQDPRLAVDGDADTELRTLPLDEIWHPRLTVINNRGLEFLFPEVATVDRRGNVVARQRMTGPLAVDLDLRDFPFDTQRLPIIVVSYEYSPSEIVFSAASRLLARLDDLGGEGWRYEAVEPERSAYRLEEGGRGGSQISFAVMAERQAGYYIFTLALPMTLILFLAWMAHWLPVDVVPPRMGTATATVFSLIALGVSFRLTLPKIPYLTDADRFALYSTLLVLVSLAVTVMSVRWASTDRKEAAEKLTGQARLAFPFLYVLIVLLTFTT